MDTSIFSNLIYSVPAVLIAIIFHEWAHGFVSYLLGDPSPKAEGRLSLNPLHHLDPVGTLCLLFFHFGWAKPVMVNPNYYKDKKMGMMLTALAGPVMNFICALIAVVVAVLIIKFNPMGLFTSNVVVYFYTVCLYTATMCIGLGVFNLLPIPPLDGSKILFSILPEDMYFAYMKYERYGVIVLVLLLSFGLANLLSPISGGILNGLMQLVASILL